MKFIKRGRNSPRLAIPPRTIPPGQIPPGTFPPRTFPPQITQQLDTNKPRFMSLKLKLTNSFFTSLQSLTFEKSYLHTYVLRYWQLTFETSYSRTSAIDD